MVLIVYVGVNSVIIKLIIRYNNTYRFLLIIEYILLKEICSRLVANRKVY